MPDAALNVMAEVVMGYDAIISDADGSRWAARACGRPGAGEMWDGWIEFVPVEPGRQPVRTPRETTQPSHDDLLYWASGLTPVYLKGALIRARLPRAKRSQRSRATLSHPILDPFNVYAQGEDILIRQLDALDTRRLRDIVRAFELMSAKDADGATRLDLATAIVTAARDAAARV